MKTARRALVPPACRPLTPVPVPVMTRSQRDRLREYDAALAYWAMRWGLPVSRAERKRVLAVLPGGLR